MEAVMRECMAKRSGQGKGGEIEGGMDESAEERRVEMLKGDFCRRCGFMLLGVFAYNRPYMVIWSVDQSRILLFDQHGEKLHKALSENVRGSSGHRVYEI
jgi:hypothetical protein